jgi:putative acetyltransferase
VVYSIRAVEAGKDIETIRTLLREYAAHLNASLGAEHICLTKYEEELAGLPSPYQVLLMAFAVDNDGKEKAAGCALLKPIEGGCEMKRLWVRPQFQGQGLGRKLTEALITEAQKRGYTAMYLDTVPDAMKTAHHLYQTLGFVPVERYNDNPVPDVVFFRRDLTVTLPGQQPA